jgi:hypothetical protein
MFARVSSFAEMRAGDRFPLPTTIRDPSIWLLSSALEIPRPFVLPRYHAPLLLGYAT